MWEKAFGGGDRRTSVGVVLEERRVGARFGGEKEFDVEDLVLLDHRVADDAQEQKHIIFDPIPRVDGIEPSADPLLELRAAIYLISGRRRRAAPES